MNKKDRLSNKEINNILDSFLKKEKREEKIKKYRDNCPEYKNKNCGGDIYTEASGCIACKTFNVFDSTNAKPVIGSEKWLELMSRYEQERQNLIDNCKLNFNDFYCEYKNVFNVCSMCSCVYKEKTK